MKSELGGVVRACGPAVATLGLLSGATNVLALTGSIFMLAVYDRVIPSGSVATLVALGVLALLVYALQGAIDILRGRMLTSLGHLIKETQSCRAYDIMVRNAALGDNRSAGAIRDLDQVHAFLSSLGPTALFDLPWLPIYLILCFFFHFYLGLAVTFGALFLVGITLLSNVLTRSPSRELEVHMQRRAALVAEGQGHSEALFAMGMIPSMAMLWRRTDQAIVFFTRRTANISAGLGTLSRVFRTALQSMVLGIGAFLVIQHQATGGIMIAASILSARALAPVELAISHWKNFVAFRQSWDRLNALFRAHPHEVAPFALPRPYRSFSCEQVSVAAPGTQFPVVRNVSFKLKAGEALLILGSTGSGKSSLARALVGVWPMIMGETRLDGELTSRWSSIEKGRFTGYVPQDVGLFEGTIAQNIARFDPGADSDRIIEAAKVAGVDRMIAQLPLGYDTRLGPHGAGLSGGQSQRLALARALYDKAFLVVLDEPNSNLDGEGEAALEQAIAHVKGYGGIVIAIAHRPSFLSTVDHLLVMSRGQARMFGPRDQVMRAIAQRSAPSEAGTAA